MNKKFPVLSVVSALLGAIGWVIVLCGAVFAVYEGLIEPSQPGHSFGGGDLVEIVIGLALVLAGLFAVGVSEIIGVLFAIEENTRTNRAQV